MKLAIPFAALLLVCGAASAGAQTPIDPRVTAALAPLPEEFRASATVLGYRPGTPGLVRLRQGNGPFICLADEPGNDRFHVACYHESLEPFMARGRQLRAERVANVDSVRNAEAQANRLPMPNHPAALYSLTGTPANVDANGIVSGARRLYVVYIPYATAESTGLSTKSAPNTPWLMFPGTPRAHIMFVPGM